MQNLARFDIVTISLIVRCAQTGSLTRAAEDGHLAVAAASRRVRELEDALGSRLFERHSRGMLVTPTGRAVVRHGIALLQRVNQLDDELHDLRSGIASHLRLCASTGAIDQFLPRLLATHAQLHPEVRVELEEQVSAGVVRALHDGLADVGVFAEGPEMRGLDARLFRNDRLVLVMPLGHRLAGVKTPLRFADALDEDWISLTAGATLLRQQQEAAFSCHRPFKLRMQVRSFDAVCHLVASGLGIALLPKGAALPMLRSLKLTWRPLLDDWASRRLLVAMVAGTRDAAVKSFVDFLAPSSQTANAEPTE